MAGHKETDLVSLTQSQRTQGVTECHPGNSPNRRRLRKRLVEALLAQQPVRVHQALALDLNQSTGLDVVAACPHQTIPRALRHVDTP